tara:strand:- start:192 stop:326 length:135 start_codon:yes stop_codon:yes gene_type:complete
MLVLGDQEKMRFMEVMDPAPKEWRKRFKANETTSIPNIKLEITL